MGLLTEAFNPTPRASWSVMDERWYVRDISGYVMESGSAGVSLSADTILRCSTVLAAVRFRGESWAMCPPSTFRKTAKGRAEDPNHYSQRVLRNPNAWQTGNRWRALHGVWMALWGNAYSEIVSGPRAFAEELRPMNPSRVRVADQRADGTLLYTYTPAGQQERRLGQEQVLHFRDLSTDGISGVEMYKLIRNVAGIALLAEKHAATFLQKGTRISGLLVPAAPLTTEQRNMLKDSVNADFGGTGSTGMLGILPHGVDLKELTRSTKDSQVLELSDQTVGTILRFLGVPGVVVGYADKTATYASAKEFFESGGIKHCVLPILLNVEAEEEKALLFEGDGRQIKHNLDVLLRSNTKERYEAHFKATGRPWMSPNEVRRIEDMNPDPDPSMDKVGLPVNITPGPVEEPEEAEPTPPPSAPRKPEPEDDNEAAAASGLLSAEVRAQIDEAGRLTSLARAYIEDNALRVVRREVATITLKAPKYARDPMAWRGFVIEMYGKHVTHVAEVMRIKEDDARAYCDRQAADLLAGGAAVVASWETDAAPRLAALAMEAA